MAQSRKTRSVRFDLYSFSVTIRFPIFRFEEGLRYFTGATLWQLYKIKLEVSIYLENFHVILSYIYF